MGSIKSWTWFVVGIIAVCGVFAGLKLTVFRAPAHTSTALIVIHGASPSGVQPAMDVQEVVATSTAVLTGALPSVSPAMSLAQLRHDVKAGSPSAGVVSITADNESAVRAVAYSYINYLNSPSEPIGHLSAILLSIGTN